MNKKKAAPFHGRRTDGFGERLRALLNTVALADYFNANFTFAWNKDFIDPSVKDIKEVEKYHIISDARDIFSPKFCEDHFLETEGPGISRRILKKGETLDSIKSALLDETQGYIVNALDLSDVIEDASRIFNPQMLSKAYKKITFSENMRRVQEYADSVDIGSNPVAIHLRAGDLIYGEYRYSDNFVGKVVPFTLVIGLIQRLKSEGKNVVLFGQDTDLCEYISNQYGCTFAADFINGREYNNLQIALFDISLMSRCQEVYAGNSGFAIFACMISGAQHINPRSIFLPKDILQLSIESEDLNKSDPRVSSLQKAFSYFYPMVFAPNRMDINQKLWIIDQAISHDPENFFYKIVRAGVLFDLNKGDEAEEMLALLCEDLDKDIAEQDIETSFFVHTLAAMRLGQPGTLRLQNQIDGLRNLTASGYPSAALCLGFMEKALNNREGVDACCEILKTVAVDGNIYDRALKSISSGKL